MARELNYIKIGARIRKARTDRHITQEKLGEICQLSTSHIGHIERGTRIPSLDTLYKISTELNVSMDYLIFDSPDADENLFTNISAMLKTKDKAKVKAFMTAVKILADRIDDM